MFWVVFLSKLVDLDPSRLREARENADPELVITLIGNKADKATMVGHGVRVRIVVPMVLRV